MIRPNSWLIWYGQGPLHTQLAQSRLIRRSSNCKADLRKGWGRACTDTSMNFVSVFRIPEDEFNENEKCLNLKQKKRKFAVRSQEVLKASHLFPWPFSQFYWVIGLHANGKNSLIIQWETQQKSQHAILTAVNRACFCVGLMCGFAFLAFNRVAEPHALLIHYRDGTHKWRSLAFINAISFLFYHLIKIGKIENFWQHW